MKKDTKISIITIIFWILMFTAPPIVGIIRAKTHPYHMTKKDADFLRAYRAQFELRKLIKESKK